MRFLNWLMTEIDKPAAKLTPYEEFYGFVSKMFENVYSETWMSQRSAKKASEEDSNPQYHPGNTDEDPAAKEKYSAKVKEYTHYAIGRKISKNVPIYS